MHVDQWWRRSVRMMDPAICKLQLEQGCRARGCCDRVSKEKWWSEGVRVMLMRRSFELLVHLSLVRIQCILLKLHAYGRTDERPHANTRELLEPQAGT